MEVEVGGIRGGEGVDDALAPGLKRVGPFVRLSARERSCGAGNRSSAAATSGTFH